MVQKMGINEQKAIIEAMLFACGRAVNINEIMAVLELPRKELELILQQMRLEYEQSPRGMEIIKINDTYQMCTKKEYAEYIYPLIDNRAKPNLSNAALETLAIIAYNQNVTRAEIESVRGVNSDGTIYKLLEYGLIEEAGKADAPGKPMTYRTTDEFLKIFGYSSLDELPDLPQIEEDIGKQISLEEFTKNKKKEENQEKEDQKEEKQETESQEENEENEPIQDT